VQLPLHLSSRCTTDIVCVARSLHDLVHLRCGRFVSPEQIDQFYQVKISRTYRQRGYDLARSTMQPYLLEKEKRFDIHSHLYEPMISTCGSPSNFENKIRSDSIVLLILILKVY
jgi:hypothetical protein